VARLAVPVVAVVAFLALTAGNARAAEFPVIVVPGLELSDLPELEDEGALGLLVPNAGPETSLELARTGLVRGQPAHSLREEPPAGAPALTLRRGTLGSARGPAIYLGLPEAEPQANRRRYPIVVVGRGYTGVLTSESTRLPGLVSAADVMPTALAQEETLGHEPREDAASSLLALERRIERNADVRRAASLVVCLLVVALALVFPPAAVGAIASALVANLALGIAGVSAPWAVLVALALAVLLGGPLLAFAWSDSFLLGLGLCSVVTGYLLALGLDGETVALSPLGPSQNARFYGLSNLLETLLLVPAFGAAALVAARFGWPAFAGVAALAFVTVADNRLGADGGGAVVLAVGFAVLGVLLAGAGRRVLAVAVGAGLAVVLALVALDAATGVSSHVTRALAGGPSGLAADLHDRVVLSWERATDTWYAALGVTVLLLLLAVLVARTLATRGIAPATAVPLAVAAALAASLVVNDSPVDVPLAGLAAYAATDLGMLPARWPGSFDSRSARSFSLWPSRPPGAAAARRSRLRPRP